MPRPPAPQPAPPASACRRAPSPGPSRPSGSYWAAAAGSIARPRAKPARYRSPAGGRGGGRRRRGGACRRFQWSSGRRRLGRRGRRYRSGARLRLQLVVAIGGVLLVRHQALGDLGAVGAVAGRRRLARHGPQIRVGLAGRCRFAGRRLRLEPAAAGQQGSRQQPVCCARPGGKALARARFRSFYGQSRFRLSCPRRAVYVAETKELPPERIIEEAAMADQQPPDMKLPAKIGGAVPCHGPDRRAIPAP